MLIDVKSKNIYFLIGIISIFTSIATLILNTKENDMPSTVTIPAHSSLDISSIDPALVVNAWQSNLIRSLYSTLVYYDTNGRIRGGAAERFEVRNNTLLFFIRNSLTTVSGIPITAEDVFLSFKRLLILNKNTHGKLADYIKCETAPKKISDNCDGIRFTNNIFEIELKDAKYASILLPMLAGADYAILPKQSVSYDSDLKIRDYRETSGAYFIDSVTKEKVRFRVNPTHYLIDSRNPDVIELALLDGNPNEQFKNGKFDLIPTFGRLYDRDIKSLGDLSDYNIHKTMPIKLFKIHFTPKGRARLSREERLSVGYHLRKAFLEAFEGKVELEPTHEYFVVVGQGTLSPNEIDNIKKEMAKAEGAIKREVTADITVTWPEKAAAIVEQIPHFKYKELKEHQDGISADDPDVFIVDTDAGGFDNISLLSYLQYLGDLGMTDSEFRQWLNQYLDTTDPAARSEISRTLHYNMLYNAHVIPIAVQPYYGIARKPWKIEAYQMFAGSPFWTIKREQ